MATTSYTQNLGLSAWGASDRPKRIDFVTDNTIIDQVLGEHVNNSDIHVTAEDKARLQNPYTVYTYLGDGEAQRTIELSDEYKFAIVFQKFYPMVEIDSNQNIVSHFAVVGRSFGSSANIELRKQSLVVTQDTEATDGVINNFNEAEGQYVALLFK